MSNTTAKIQYNKTKFTNNGDWNYEDLGKFSEHCKGMTIKFTKNNLAGDKKVTIIGTPKNGEPINFYCTGPLSKVVRKVLTNGAKQTDVLGTLLNYHLQVDKDNPNKYFIFQPAGNELEGLVVTDEVIDNFEDSVF